MFSGTAGSCLSQDFRNTHGTSTCTWELLLITWYLAQAGIAPNCFPNLPARAQRAKFSEKFSYVWHPVSQISEKFVVYTLVGLLSTVAGHCPSPLSYTRPLRR